MPLSEEQMDKICTEKITICEVQAKATGHDWLSGAWMLGNGYWIPLAIDSTDQRARDIRFIPMVRVTPEGTYIAETAQ